MGNWGSVHGYSMRLRAKGQEPISDKEGWLKSDFQKAFKVGRPKVEATSRYEQWGTATRIKGANAFRSERTDSETNALERSSRRLEHKLLKGKGSGKESPFYVGA